jgi:hypothetical protein
MLKYLIPFILLGLTACELNEEELLKSIVGTADEVPEGTYLSQCVLSEDGLTGTKYTVELGADSYTIQEDTFTDNECLVTDSVGTPSDAIAVELPGPNLGDGFSFFTAGELKVPYFYDGTDFVIGEPQERLPNGQDDFSGFQQDLEAGRIAVYQIQAI